MDVETIPVVRAIVSLLQVAIYSVQDQSNVVKSVLQVLVRLSMHGTNLVRLEALESLFLCFNKLNDLFQVLMCVRLQYKQPCVHSRF